MELDPDVISLARDILELKFEQPDANQPASKRQRVDKTAGYLECVEADALDFMKRVPKQQAPQQDLDLQIEFCVAPGELPAAGCI